MSAAEAKKPAAVSLTIGDVRRVAQRSVLADFALQRAQRQRAHDLALTGDVDAVTTLVASAKRTVTGGEQLQSATRKSSTVASFSSSLHLMTTQSTKIAFIMLTGLAGVITGTALYIGVTMNRFALLGVPPMALATYRQWEFVERGLRDERLAAATREARVGAKAQVPVSHYEPVNGAKAPAATEESLDDSPLS